MNSRGGGCAPAHVGIAGSMSGLRTSHAAFFRAALAFFEARTIPALLGDDGSSPEQALAMAHGFVDNNVRLVIGHFNSACARAVIPLYRAHGIALLLPASTDVGLDLRAGVYRLCGTDASQAQHIAQAIRARAEGPFAVEVRADGSDYSHRLLQCLRAELGAAIQGVFDTTDPAPPRAPFCVVLATAHRAVAFVTMQHPVAPPCVVIYSDEAAVAEVDSAIRDAGGQCWIVTPRPSYETLLGDGCRLIADWYDRRAQPFGEWAQRQGHFLATGEVARTQWELRRCGAA
jgi:branched-chain amino acid transport system substrate-binding protein